METVATRALRRPVQYVLGLFFTGVFALMAAPDSLEARTPDLASSSPYIVGNDRGGLLERRLRELGALRQSGRPVQITGRVCFSTCTMFLGLPQTCVSPRTTFGFHGPSSFGRSLDPKTFDTASAVIASYYPDELKAWYMKKGRFRIRTLYRIRGEDIIALGVPAC